MMWYFKYANSDNIKRAIDIFDWESPYFIPNETIICEERDSPWMNSFIKNLARAKDNFYKNLFLKAVICIKNLQTHLNQSSRIAKQNYVNKIAQRLGDPNISSKCYWSLLKTLLNGKKIPCIPPLFHGD